MPIRGWLVLCVLVGSVLGLGTAMGQGDARDLFEAGAFVAAYEQAINLETGAEQILASRAASAQGLYVAASADELMAWLGRAQVAAERATRIVPEDPEAWLELARARGEMALRTDIWQNLDVASRLREMIDRALALDPDNPNALVALGMWHLGLTERGVGWMFGARRDDVLDLVSRGVQLAPRAIELRIEYAKALHALGAPASAREQLDVALALPARTAVDRHLQEVAARLLADID